MCTPLLILGGALTLGSTVASASANQSVERARDRAAFAETQRQEGFQANALARFNEGLEGFAPETQRQEIANVGQERAERLQENIQGTAPEEIAALTGSSSAPRIVRETAAAQINKGLGRGRAFAGQLGRLGAFGEQQFGNQIRLGDLSSDLARIGQESARSARILPLEFQSANRRGARGRGVADILGAAGSVAGLASLAPGAGVPTDAAGRILGGV